MSNVMKYFSHSPRYYLRHPFEWIGDKCRALKWARQRVVRGYADCDVWNLDNWFSDVVSGALTHLAEHHCGWPDHLFKTPEEWTAWLKKAAAAIKMMDEEEQDKVNKYWPPYRDELDNWQIKGYKGPSQAFRNYTDEAQRIAAEAQKNFEAVMSEFVQYFSALWD